MVEDVPMRVACVDFATSFLVFDVEDSYDMMLGRPWLLQATKALHN